jgi:hypothetical protein
MQNWLSFRQLKRISPDFCVFALVLLCQLLNKLLVSEKKDFSLTKHVSLLMWQTQRALQNVPQARDRTH